MSAKADPAGTVELAKKIPGASCVWGRGTSRAVPCGLMVGTQIMLGDTCAIIALFTNGDEVMFQTVLFYTLEFVLRALRQEGNFVKVEIQPWPVWLSGSSQGPCTDGLWIPFPIKTHV